LKESFSQKQKTIGYKRHKGYIDLDQFFVKMFWIIAYKPEENEKKNAE
jgi:hypothetical protein